MSALILSLTPCVEPALWTGGIDAGSVGGIFRHMTEMDRFDLKASALPVTPLTALEPCEPELAEPFAVIRPQRGTSPLVVSSPHSGNIYPARFVEASQLDALTLRRSEDAHVDRLLDHAPKLGAVFMKAHFPRAYVDVNREPYELDPRMFDGPLPSFVNSRSLRVAGGLGTIARVVGEAKDIYPRKLPVAEAFRRIDALYVPWHRTLRGLLSEAHRAHGQAVLIDFHSMPSNAGRAERIKADIVLGDRFGTSCDPAIMEAADAALRAFGYQVARNKPYAGGFITEHYGDPMQGWHALQIEINRALYMDEATLDLLATFNELRRHLREMLCAVTEAIDGSRDQALAAE